MIEIEIAPENAKDLLVQIQEAIGGVIEENWSECNLLIDNEFGKGNIRFIPFDWGVNLLEINAIFHNPVIMKIKANTAFNPIRFMYVLHGHFTHRFSTHKKEALVEQFQSLIFSHTSEAYNYIHFPNALKLEVNSIQIIRKKFINKRTTNIATLNSKLYEVFMDTAHKKQFMHHGQLNLKMADEVLGLRKIKGAGMLRLLKIEAKIYEILSLHIQQHNRLLQGTSLPETLTKSELKIIRGLAKEILDTPSKEYSLNYLATTAGLSQVKLQEGFKFLYKRTVTEYVRHIRLEAARNLLKKTDLNISQVVYTIGFTSRSYFSKIFREKFGVTPNQFKRKTLHLSRT